MNRGKPAQINQATSDYISYSGKTYAGQLIIFENFYLQLKLFPERYRDGIG